MGLVASQVRHLYNLLFPLPSLASPPANIPLLPTPYSLQIEYLLWRTHTYGVASRGFGITLRGATLAKNWATDRFVPEADATRCFRVVDGIDGTG